MMRAYRGNLETDQTYKLKQANERVLSSDRIHHNPPSHSFATCGQVPNQTSKSLRRRGQTPDSGVQSYRIEADWILILSRNPDKPWHC